VVVAVLSRTVSPLAERPCLSEISLDGVQIYCIATASYGQARPDLTTLEGAGHCHWHVHADHIDCLLHAL